MNFENLNVHILNECLNLYYYFPKFYNLDYDNETTEESTNKKFFLYLKYLWIPTKFYILKESHIDL